MEISVHKAFAFAASIVMLALPVAAQYRTVDPPSTYGTLSLRDIDTGYVIPELYPGGGDSWDSWSSSFLKADGQAPKKPAATGDEDTDIENESDFSERYAAWAAMYSAQSVMDGDPATAWAEGAKGPGVGEVVVARIPEPEGIGIMPGFQRSADLFARNARPRKVRVWLLAASRMDVGQYENYYYDVKALAFHDIELADAMGWQALPLPAAAAPPTTMSGGYEGEPFTDWFVAVRVLSVYPGSRWEDCCISEIGPAP